MLWPTASAGYFLFPTLGCAVPVVPGGIIIFSGVEWHRGIPLLIGSRDRSPLPAGYDIERRFNVICYPKYGIISG